MQIAITAATEGELALTRQQVSHAYAQTGTPVNISFHATGVGMLATAVSLTKLAIEQKPGFIVQAGIAGCFDNASGLGEVFAVNNEMLADMGVNEDGIWKDMFDLALEKDNNTPFTERCLPNNNLVKYNLLKLPVVNAVTINEITTSPKRRLQIEEKYAPFIESMEGAALHYVCGLQNIPFIQMRAISNYIGERDKTKWKMKEAIINLNNTLLDYLQALENSIHLNTGNR
ncbi:MAG TPA: futalosine hydrolase [Chitinophagaceae bacterium]|nr:futalosine hydrolase [Chitinophagaceae bacterium]